jgi:hypothetical protein
MSDLSDEQCGKAKKHSPREIREREEIAIDERARTQQMKELVDQIAVQMRDGHPFCVAVFQCKNRT